MVGQMIKNLRFSTENEKVPGLQCAGVKSMCATVVDPLCLREITHQSKLKLGTPVSVYLF